MEVRIMIICCGNCRWYHGKYCIALPQWEKIGDIREHKCSFYQEVETYSPDNPEQNPDLKTRRKLALYPVLKDKVISYLYQLELNLAHSIDEWHLRQKTNPFPSTGGELQAIINGWENRINELKAILDEAKKLEEE